MDQFEKQKFIMIVESVILNEMPIKTKLVGDFDKLRTDWVGDSILRNGGFDDTDRKLLTSQKGIEKITKQWERTKFNFDVYFLSNVKTNQMYQEIGPIDLRYLRTQLQISSDEIPDPKPDSITVIFNGNYGTDKTPMTGWTIAHRFGHAMNRHIERMRQQTEEFEEFERELKTILRNILGTIYGIYFTSMNDPGLGEVFQQIGTMKSARDKKLNRGYEFVYELIAQYLLTGSVKFQLPKVIKYYGDVYPSNRVQLEEYNKDLPGFEKNIVSLIEQLIQTFVGKTLLM